MDLKKFDNNEVLRKFEANEHEKFPPLTLSEKHKCVLYAMEMVHFCVRYFFQVKKRNDKKQTFLSIKKYKQLMKFLIILKIQP